MAPTSERDRDSLELAVIDLIEELIADGSVVIYTSVSGKPFLHSSIAGLTSLNHALSDRLCAAWIAQLAYQRFRTILPLHTAQRLCLVLAGRAPTARPDHAEDGGELVAMSTNHFVALVAAFAEKHVTRDYEKRTRDFLDALRDFATNLQAPWLLRAVPTNASWLGRLLAKNKDLLLAVGIVVDRRVSDGKWVRLSRVPDGTAATESAMGSGEIPAKTESELMLDAIRGAADMQDDKGTSESSERGDG